METFPDADDLPAVAAMPDPLTFWGDGGARVTTREQWETRRKPELRALFQRYMYGTLPPPPPAVTATVRSESDCLGGKATRRQITVAFGPPACPAIELMLLLPRRRRPAGAAPPAVLLGLNFGGNHTVLDDPAIPLPAGWMPPAPGVEENRATEAGRGRAQEAWSAERIIDRGYGLATFYAGDIAPDRPDFAGGIFPFLDIVGGAAPVGERPPDACGVLAAWAWGLHRAIDALARIPDADSGRIVLFGHSRNGKAALLAGAFDERAAGVIAHQAGCGGSAPSRCENPQAETVTRITSHFPAWFCPDFARFGGREAHLPFDQNCLAALCAPRPVLFSAGTLDVWADPPGQFDVLQAADPAYRLLGVSGSGGPPVPPPADRLLGDRLCYYNRAETRHLVDGGYWDVFLDFADAVPAIVS